jgi:hypothetical protein
MTTDPEPKPKRKRRSKVEREAEEAARRAELASQPIDPVIWIILGALILFVALFTWLDPVTLANAGNNPSIFQYIPVLMIRIFGQTLASIILTLLGAVPLVYGIIGWLRKRAKRL